MSTVMTNKFLSTFGYLLFTIIIIIWIVDLAIFYFQNKKQNLIFSKVSIALFKLKWHIDEFCKGAIMNGLIVDIKDSNIRNASV